MIRNVPLAPSRRLSGRGAARARRVGDRRGFTLVEAIVAIVLLSVGILAMASSSGVIIRDMSGASQRTKAAARASEKLEMLRGYNNCAAVRAAVAANPPMSQAAAPGAAGGSSALLIRYPVSYKAGRKTRTDTFKTEIPCIGP